MTATAEQWARYDSWNRAVEELFFDGRFAGRPVYLDLESEVLRQLGALAGEPGGSEDRLIEVVRPTLNLPDTNRPLLEAHAVRLARWRNGEGNEPLPVLCLLAFFSLVAESMAAEDGLAANNYYGRMCELLGLDYDDRDIYERITGDFRKHGTKMWSALNQWLEAYEGQRGLPTAFASDFRIYVGPAISQALVKEADRRKLPAMFRAYGLPAGYSMSLSDMERLLAEWLPSSNVSNSLKNSFKRGIEARRRIAAVARLELETWDGVEEMSRGGASAPPPLRLLAVIRRFLGARLEFGLAGRLRTDAHEATLRLVNDDPVASEAVRASGRELTFVATGDGWIRLADDPGISWPDLISAPLELAATTNDGRLRRAPTRLIVLREEPTLSAYVETDRAPLAENCLVLAHKSIAPDVAGMLKAAARPGFVRADGLRGVPDAWVLFTDVQILASVDATSVDLQPLTPVSWTQLVLADGFTLPGRTRKWHRKRPPEVRVASQSLDKSVVKINPLRFLDDVGVRVQASELGRVKGVAVFPLDGLELPVGDYQITLEDPKRVLSEATLRLRDGNLPAVESIAEPDVVVRRLEPGDAKALLTGDLLPGASIADIEVIQGALVDGEVLPTLGTAMPVPARPAWTAEGRQSRGRDLEDVVQREQPILPERESCLVTGAHYFILPTFKGRTKGPTVSGRCRDCGLVEWWPSRPVKHGKSAELMGSRAPAVDVTSVAPIQRHAPVDWEFLIDALTHVRRGKWGAFEGIARQGEDTALFIHDLGRVLEGLGHFEVRRDPATLDPTDWEVPAITIYTTPDGRAIVTGARPGALVAEIGIVAEKLGGEINISEHPESSPATIALEGLDVEELERAVELLRISLRRPVAFSHEPARKILARLPRLWSMFAALPRRPLPHAAELQLFDPTAGRWEDCVEAVHVGGYRVRVGRRRYFVRTEADLHEGQVRYADPFTVKHAGAALSGAPLVAYQETDHTLVTPLGAELPGLFERVAVLCSGQPPQKLKSGMTVYGGVPQSYAEALADRLFRATED